ncbi:MAG: ATPase [Proteobacteria bacterium]|nr:ATPase [Pseudomonadota bacterium]NBY20938.1 ATPase [bacterium]
MVENSLSAIAPSPEICAQLTEDSKTLALILDEMGKVIVGQEAMNRALLSGVITGGHILLEGLPGLAKTLAVRTLARVLDAKFQRIQFTPDLLPSDLIGTMVYHEATSDFTPKKGPIFANLVLADEINRAPAKVQSALLEAMAEKQVTLGDQSYKLAEPFLVLATQNPIEQEGTYHLPEAQLDRFMFKLKIGYPNRNEERIILERMANQSSPETFKVFSTQGILEIRDRVEKIYVDDRIKNYVLRLVLSTRKQEFISGEEADAKSLEKLRSLIHIGASPRATLFLIRAARVNALFEQRSFVTPDDVKAIALDILRHRIILNFDAEARGFSTDDVIYQLLETVNVP